MKRSHLISLAALLAVFTSSGARAEPAKVTETLEQARQHTEVAFGHKVCAWRTTMDPVKYGRCPVAPEASPGDLCKCGVHEGVVTLVRH